MVSDILVSRVCVIDSGAGQGNSASGAIPFGIFSRRWMNCCPKKLRLALGCEVEEASEC